MTTALVFAVHPDPRDPARPSAALRVDGRSLLSRLAGQLRSLGVDDVRVVTRPEYGPVVSEAGWPVELCADTGEELALVASVGRELAEQPGSTLLLCHGDLLAHRTAVGAVAAAGVTSTTALVGSRRGADHQAPIVRQRDRVISVGTAWHQVTAPNASFRGVLKIGHDDLPFLADVCDRLLATGADLDAWAGDGNAVDLALLGVVRSGLRVPARFLRALVCRRVRDENEVASTVDLMRRVDEDAVSLRLAVKEHDDLFATFAVSSYSPRIVRLVARTGISPTTVTWISTALAVAAAVAFGSGTRATVVAGSVLLYLGFLFDCIDGQLARYTQRYSAFGGWLDMIADRAKEYIVYAGLAVGALRVGVKDAWMFALTLLVMQTVRHMVDTWYGALQEAAVNRLPVAPLAMREDALAHTGEMPRSRSLRLGRKLGRLSAKVQSDKGSAGYWFKRTVVFPIGERWLVIMVTAPLLLGHATFYAMLGWGLVAMVYTLTGRTLRARAMRVPTMPEHNIPVHRDDGPVSTLLSLRSRLPRPRPLPVVLGVTVFGAVLLALTTGVLHEPLLSGTDDRLLLVALAVLLLAGLPAGHRHDGALDWLVPPVLRAAEYLFVLFVAVNDGVAPWLTFALLTILALNHYDLAARLDKRSSPLGNVRWGLGWDGRAIVLTAAGVADAAEYAFGFLGVYLAAMLTIGAVVGTLRQRPRPHAARNRIPVQRGPVEPQPALGRSVTR
ncbi:DUF5941 domain-containing protein [Planosporangium sp. 12N6]|uniref:DUF5941 domain-containing protein n=1 Tax=Planosporangium spinosum TaxID=3402278 RepID=UPI003CEE3DAF